MYEKESIIDFLNDPENLFEPDIIKIIEETLAKIRELRRKGKKNEDMELAKELFDELSKDDIGKKLLKIYKFGSKPKKDDLRTLIYLKDLSHSIEIAIIEADNKNVLSFMKKLIFDFFDNYYEGDAGEKSQESLESKQIDLKMNFLF